jgi:serine/threonine-protein kinase
MTDIPAPLQNALTDRYEIERELGQGGMAVVYLAKDLKHNRQVALKVLRPELAAVVGAERFLAEIQTTANLQHPHVLPLFDSGEAGTFVYYVMPYVEGESLRERLDRERQLPVEEAVRIASSIGSALDHAHRKGVVHRDIKPANVLMQDGQPVLADFGIALAVGAAGGARLTETGLSVGTPYYMSPEQATGDQAIGPASDIYAVGCVLYEMLVGEPPYTGATAQAVLGKILATELTAPRAQRQSVPPHVDAAIRKSLEKLPADRFSTAGDFVKALGDPGFRYGEDAEAGSAAAGAGPGLWKPVALGAVAVAAVSLISGVLGGGAGGGAANGIRDLGLPHDAPLQMGYYRNFAVAPNGEFIVYEAQSGETTQLWIRDIDGQNAEPIRGTEGAMSTPRISPDSRRVAFLSGGVLQVADLESGTVSQVAPAMDLHGGGWGDDGLIMSSDEDGRWIKWMDPEEGIVQEVQVGYCMYPSRVPGTDLFICGGGGDKLASTRSISDPTTLRYWTGGGRVEGSSIDRVSGADFRIIDDEYVVYLSLDGTLRATRIESADSLRFGRSVALLPGVRRETYTGAGQWDVTADGTLVYVPGLNAEVGRMVRVDSTGLVSPLPLEPAAFLRFKLGPDGRSFATVVDGVQQQELRIYDLQTGAYQVHDEALTISTPQWSPDGDHLVYQRSRDGGEDAVAMLRLNSSEGPQTIIEGELGTDYTPNTYLADTLMVIGAWSSSGQSAATLDPTSSPPTLEPFPIEAGFVEMSPDGRWLAYQNQGAPGLFLVPWPSLDRRYVIDPSGADPKWISENEIAYWSFPFEAEAASTGASLWRIPIYPDQANPVGERELVINDPRFADTPGPSFAVLNDGDLAYKHTPSENLGLYFRVVPGWVEEMKARVDEVNR